MNDIAIDTETTGLNPWKGDRPFAISMAWGTGATFYCQWHVNPLTREPQHRKADVENVKGFACSDAWRKVFWNAKFDVRMLAAVGIDVTGQIAEGEFMSKACLGAEKRHGLKPISAKVAGFSSDDEDELHKAAIAARRIAKKLGWKIATEQSHGKESHKADYWIPRQLALLDKTLPRTWLTVCERYAVRDAERTLKTCAILEAGMEDMQVQGVYDEEMELWPCTYAMETVGIEVDLAKLDALITKCRRIRDEKLAVLRKAAADPDFNPDSGPQLIKLLFDRCKLPVDDRTPTGLPKTDNKTIIKHKQHPIVRTLFEFRSNANALSDMLEKLHRLGTNHDNGRMTIHPQLRQWGTRTRRFSCTDPPLQCVANPLTTNSPTAEFLVNCRSVFVPRRGKTWLCLDYSQLEVVIFADVAKVESMLEAIREGRDIHAAVTDRVWGGNTDRALMAAMDVMETQDATAAKATLKKHGWKITELESAFGKKRFRKLAKGLTFNKIFGGGVDGAMAFTGLSKSDAKVMIAQYDEANSDLAESQRAIVSAAKKDGGVRNKFGQWLPIERDLAYRGLNYHVQSDAAALIKRAMVKCHRLITHKFPGVRLLLQVHDELIFEMDTRLATKKLARALAAEMADHGGVFSVPIRVDCEKTATSWADKEKVEL